MGEFCLEFSSPFPLQLRKMKQFAVCVVLFALYQIGYCNCLFQNPENSLWYNLAPMTLPVGPNYNVTDSLQNTYYINICAQASQGSCSPQNGVCQRESSGKSNGCGSGINPDFYPYQYNPKSSDGVTLVYLGGDFCQRWGKGRASYLNLLCDPTLAGPGIVERALEEPSYPCVYSIYLKSQYACGRATQQEALNFEGIPLDGEQSGMKVNIGWLVIFFICIFIFLYVIIGVAVKFKKYEARGIELVPNISFWVEVPFLFKDGCVFFANKVSCGKVCVDYSYGRETTY